MRTNGQERRHRRGRWRVLGLLWMAALVTAGCGDAGDTQVAVPDETPDEVAQPICTQIDFENVVDAALCPKVQQEGLSPRFTTAEALCRRLSVDLTGRTPTWSEVQVNCIGKTPTQMVDHFMDQPEYLMLAQRRWADLFQYNDFFSHYRHIEAHDDLVAQLYEDAIDYDTFGIETLSSPAYAGRFFGEARVARAFQIFLGRDAHPVEREDMVGLWMMWLPLQAFDTDYYYEYLETVVYAGLCQPPQDELLCHSSLYGNHTVTLPMRDPNDPLAFENFVRPEDLTEEEREVLRTPGLVITSLPFYHEHAVIEAMDRYLGWEASRALPEVRQALLDHFLQEGLSVRKMERALLTSALYTQTTAPPEGELDPETGEAPSWRYSRVKLMEVEVWLDSIMQSVQRDFGHCDHRFPYVRNGFHPSQNQQVYAPHDYPVADGQTGAPDMTYAALARSLGGCPDRAQFFRFTGTGVIHALDQEAVLSFLCHLPESTGIRPGGAFGQAFEPDASAQSRQDLYVHQVRTFFSRTPNDAEVQDFIDATQPCLDAGECAPESLPAQLCTTLVQNAAFLYY